MAKAFVGFRLNSNYKLLSIEDINIDIKPEDLGANFLYRMMIGVGNISNPKSSIKYFHSINAIDEEGKERDGYRSMYRLSTRDENLSKSKDGDLNWISVPYFSRGRPTRFTIFPDQTKEVIENIQDYTWGYIFNAEKMAVEFYGRDYKTPINNSMGIPYFASVNIHSAYVFMNLQKNFNPIPLLYRNNEQEFILQDSLKIAKPHRSKK